MALKLIDKNKKLYQYRSTPNGAILTKGKRQIHFLFSSVNESNKAKKVIAQNSFNKLFMKGRKIKALGGNVVYISFKNK